MQEYDFDFLFDILSFSPPVGVFFVYRIFINIYYHLLSINESFGSNSIFSDVKYKVPTSKLARTEDFFNSSSWRAAFAISISILRY